MIRSLHSKNNTNPNDEDARTSTIISRMLYLPDDIVWKLFRSSILGVTDLPCHVGDIVSFDFWPKWMAVGSDNSESVEPDVFIRFEDLDVIIEAKRNDGKGQNLKQWKNEVIAYVNEYGHEKSVVLLALGGNQDNSKVRVRELEAGVSIPCYCISWHMLCLNFEQQREITKERNLCAILDDLLLACSLFGFCKYKWFDDVSWYTYIQGNNFCQIDFQGVRENFSGGDEKIEYS